MFKKIIISDITIDCKKIKYAPCYVPFYILPWLKFTIVSGAVDLARLWGLSEALIGLTIVSIGTGTPELATALMAAYRKTADIAIGNAVGSNLFNIMFVVGLAGLVAPMDATGINSSDLYVMFGLTILLLPTVWTGMVLDRKEGFLFVAIYVAYLYYLWPVK